MLPFSETDAMPVWVLIFERIGPGSAILVFTGAVLWKLLPEMTKLLKAWKAQSDTITKAVPTVLGSLDRLADNMEKGFEAMNARTYEIRDFRAHAPKDVG